MGHRSPLLLPILGWFLAIPGAAESGVALGLDLTLEASAGLSGGNRRGQAFHGLALGRVEWTQAGRDPQGLLCRAYGSVLVLAGRGPTGAFLGDFLAASNMEGLSGTRLYASWLEAGRPGWSLRGGALLADEEFAGTEGGGDFLNSAFGWPPFLSANTVNTGPAFFLPALGLRFERAWGETVIWRTGVYDGDTFDSPTGDPAMNRHGARFQVGGEQGWFAISEATFAAARIPVRGKIGLWMHSANFGDVRDDANGRPFAITGASPRQHSANYGVYVAIERRPAGRPDQAGRTEIFLRCGAAPRDRNAIGWAVDAGVSRTGLLPGRPADVVALGVAHATFGSHYAESARLADPSIPVPDYEQVVEASYTLKLSEQWSLQPDLQYIRHPGGSSGYGDALVFLLRANVSY